MEVQRQDPDLTPYQKFIEEGRARLDQADTGPLPFGTVTDQSRILILKNGGIVESGTFSELLDKKGEFFELYSVKRPISVEKNIESRLQKITAKV